MILNMDKIQFENRAEIGAIIKALEVKNGKRITERMKQYKS